MVASGRSPVAASASRSRPPPRLHDTLRITAGGVQVDAAETRPRRRASGRVDVIKEVAAGGSPPRQPVPRSRGWRTRRSRRPAVQPQARPRRPGRGGPRITVHLGGPAHRERVRAIAHRILHTRPLPVEQRIDRLRHAVEVEAPGQEPIHPFGPARGHSTAARWSTGSTSQSGRATNSRSTLARWAANALANRPPPAHRRRIRSGAPAPGVATAVPRRGSAGRTGSVSAHRPADTSGIRDDPWRTCPGPRQATRSPSRAEVA